MSFKYCFLFMLIFGVGLSNISAQSAGAPSTPKQISGGVLNGKATSLPKPVYPEAAKAVRASGAVNVQVTIDEDGNVISATAVSGHPLLRSAAVDAAKKAKFAPTLLSGQPVKVTGVIVYNFVLPNNSAQNDSEKLIPMGVVMFITAMKDLPTDEESDQIMLDLGKALPASMSVEKSQFDRLVNAKSRGEKNRIIDEIIASIRKDLTGTDAWMVDLGKNWGSAIGEAYQIVDSDYKRERKDFIKSLQGMNWLLESPPKDISNTTIEKIRAISNYDNETDSITPEFITNFFKSSLDFIEYMIKTGKK